MNAPLVLLYNLDNRNGSRLRLICLKLHIRVRTVAPGSSNISPSSVESSSCQ